METLTDSQVLGILVLLGETNGSMMSLEHEQIKAGSFFYEPLDDYPEIDEDHEQELNELYDMFLEEGEKRDIVKFKD